MSASRQQARSHALHRLGQALLAPGARGGIERAIARWLADHALTGPCLDVGCGPVSRLRGVGLDPVGVDVSAETTAVLRKSGGMAVAASAVALPFADESFTSVWTFGLLHHLTDTSARRALSEMVRVTRGEGFTVVFDGVKPVRPLTRPFAWLVRQLDRGRWMRGEEEMELLLQPWEGWERQRFTYSRSGLEGVLWSRAKARRSACRH